MKTRIVFLFSVAGVLLLTASHLPVAQADRLELKDGSRVEGVIQKIEKGQITIQVGAETKVLDILEVTRMDFDTPHIPAGTSRLPLEHFLGNMEAQEMVGHIQAVEKSAAEIRALLDQTRQEWGTRKEIAPEEAPQWDAQKDQFRTKLSRYQEVLNDFYFHILGKVDQYNQLTGEARDVYVGVKGPLNMGSRLVSREMRQLPLKKYVPSNWYDTIFYEGYNRGYNEAYERYSTQF